ncbi:VOC family protein [uncultured Litoreibacter sp.]|uniref:VOC family protein n=1 Tax=uncultured Litoreibacter sp. TaxID=1392394 RepID=UPI00260A5F96|nr:VOC family protein [uncultured Litoreibacter sp.]
MSTVPQHAVVWAEIPVKNLANAVKFYSAVLQQEMAIEKQGPNPVAFFVAKDFATSISGHLYEGTPGVKGGGATVHLAVSGTVEDARDRVFEAGGTSTGDIVAMPFGRFAYCIDPDGNSIGLFEAA